MHHASLRLLFKFLTSLAILAFVPPTTHAEPPRDPALDLKAEGMTLSDGSSYFSFAKDGTFSSYPINFSGRLLTGTWRIESHSPGSATKVVAIAEADWINGQTGFSATPFRRIVFLIYSGAYLPANEQPYAGREGATPKVFRCYWLIDELEKISAPDR